MQEMRVWSLGWEDLLEKWQTHSNILAWQIPWTEEPDQLQSMELQKSRTCLINEMTVMSNSTHRNLTNLDEMKQFCKKHYYNSHNVKEKNVHSPITTQEIDFVT